MSPSLSRQVESSSESSAVVLTYLMPPIWMTVDILGEQEKRTDLQKTLKADIVRQAKNHDNQQVYAVQRIKLPLLCDPQLSEAYGEPAFVKTYAHDNFLRRPTNATMWST
jgi:hypothetical protein